MPKTTTCSLHTNYYRFDSIPLLEEKIKIENIRTDMIPIRELLNSSEENIFAEVTELLKVSSPFKSRSTISLDPLKTRIDAPKVNLTHANIGLITPVAAIECGLSIVWQKYESK